MSLYTQLKQLLIGKSLPNSASASERLTIPEGLAILASDALSSTAYATEETLLILVAAGSGALTLSIPISIAITVVLAIVVMSYRQTVKAYPHGGGSYTVARSNLGLYPGLVAAASLMIDYVLTVTVSIAAGTAAVTSAFPQLLPLTVPLSVFFTLLLMVANLRGVKESGRIFMMPTYAYVGSIYLLIGAGLVAQITGHIPPEGPPIAAQESLSLFLILKAFSSGCTALTGVEAISNGVMAFKPPEWKKASRTLVTLGLLLGSMFFGLSYVCNSYHIRPQGDQTVVSLLGHQVFGNSPIYYFIQFATLLILVLAANTSFADFPRLCSLLARDGFCPRQLAVLGDRLVYSNGIILLSAFAIILEMIFGAQVDAIIPLYAVGVFTAFTLSQAGMVWHWVKDKTEGWQASAVMNGSGALATAVVLVVIVYTKFSEGAWLVVVTVPLMVLGFVAINNHYKYFAQRLNAQEISPRSYLPRPKVEVATHPAVVVVGQINRGTVEALDYARSIADEIVALHVDIGSTNRDQMLKDWHKFEPDIPLVILDSPYRSIIDPILEYLSVFEAKHPGVFSTVIIPAYVPRNWWESLLHNQTTLFLKAALRANKSRVVTTVRYYL